MEIHGTWFDIQVTKVLVETTQLEFRMQLAKVKVHTGCGGCRNSLNRVDRR
jgi:hypothetical protein